VRATLRNLFLALFGKYGPSTTTTNLVGQTLTVEPSVLRTIIPEALSKSKPFSRLCTAVLSVTLPVNFGSNLGKVFVTNLITFCTLFLFSVPLSSNCAGYVYLCNMTFVCSLSNWPYELKPASQ
jgi:hypothetical protein